MLAFRSLDPFRALREPDRRRRDEERLSRSEQRTDYKNDCLTGKAPYRFESFSLHRRDANLTSSMRWTKPLSIIPVCACSRMHLGQAQGGFEIGFSPSRSTGDFSRASPPSAFGSWQS